MRRPSAVIRVPEVTMQYMMLIYETPEDFETGRAQKSAYALIELIRSGTPETLVDRLLRERQARDQLAAMIPLMFMGAISWA
jgi:hypothetical protein